ncbi:MAG: aminotransferase class V-fold PLP-dependent enzyme [Miltoncostaeaceae bacterium]
MRFEEDEPGWLPSVRAALGVCAGPELYLNHGGAGPLPEPAVAASVDALRLGAERGRGTLEAVMRMEGVAARLRARVAGLLGAVPRQVGLTSNTTNGLNVAIWGLDWHEGDEVITTALEHPGLSVPLGVLARRRGVRLHHIPSREAHDDLPGAVAALVGPRTRMVALSHVAYGTGAVLDIAATAAAIAGSGALVVVDGAQSAGAIPVDVGALGADVYAVPAHKWLYGPEGLGAVWVADAAQDRLDIAFSGYESGTAHTPDGGLSAHPGARRFEMSTPPMPLLSGWAASLDWLEETGWPAVHERILAGAAAARAALSDIPGLEVLTPEGPQAGLLSFALEGHDAARACARMAARGVIVRWLEHPPALRASWGFHWCHGDVTRLREAVAAVCGC